MTDVTIPAETARNIANYLRDCGFRGSWLQLLDPPAPSMRDEVIDAIAAIADWDDPDAFAGDIADAALAVVRRHVEAVTDWTLLRPGHSGPPISGWVRRDDVLRLLGGDDE